MARVLIRLVIAAALVLLPDATWAQNHRGDRQHQGSQRQELKRQYEAFLGQRQACERDDLAACDQALRYPKLTTRDGQVLLVRRSAILAAQREAMERERIAAEAAEAAERSRIEQERLAALNVAQAHRDSAIRPLPSPPLAVLIIGIALLLGYLAARFGMRFRGVHRHFKVAGLALRAFVATLPRRLKPRSASSDPREPTLAGVASNACEAALPYRPRDTIGAIAALELAQSYIEEVRDADVPDLEDTILRKLHLNTLALASKKLAAAQRLDPDAVLECQDSRGLARRFSINELKAEALLLEGLTHQVCNVRRAIPALIGATQTNPDNPHAFFALGLTQAANSNKAAAVAALQRAVALRPKNLTYRKELGRAENLTAAEVAGYRSTRVGERIVDATIPGRNRFAVARNIAIFQLRTVGGALRHLRQTSFHQ